MYTMMLSNNCIHIAFEELSTYSLYFHCGISILLRILIHRRILDFERGVGYFIGQAGASKIKQGNTLLHDLSPLYFYTIL